MLAVTFALAPASVLAPMPTLSFASSYGDFWVVPQQTAPDFDMVPGDLGGFSRPLFDTGIADLGKRWRSAASGVDFACKTAQKSLPGYSPSAPFTASTRNAVAPLPQGPS